MTERDRKQSVAQENAILVKLLDPSIQYSDDPLEELDGLATTAGTTVVGKLTQRREKPDPGTYLGKGKIEELSLCAEASEADVIIFDNELSPGQTRNLERETKRKVIDRTELILDIFATHAQTLESRLAVELAQLEYSLPRLKRMWSHLDRIKMGVGMRGPGEKQLEVDRRLVEKRIRDLKDDLEKVAKRREREVAARKESMTISLVGYTNAGKSTLMNALTSAQVLSADMLFATLDTRTRRWRLPHWGPVLLSDTVGFIRDLPHRLIASFKATLEEANQADLLLHVADASNPEVEQQIAAVYDVLEEIGIEQKSTLLVLNKVDRIEDPRRLEQLLIRFPYAVSVSAVSREGLDKLAIAVSDALSKSFSDVEIEAAVDNGKLVAYLAKNGEIVSKRYGNEKLFVHCRIPTAHLGRIENQNPDAVIRPYQYTSDPEESGAVGDVA
ncbi:GTPase HflX [Blastopirellula marina]|uniref:GTPase HflX n=1 Tax=Blastopirellula marina TaxID=124 RepID=A0A2S8F5Z2_9BACT|nr:MULTISPECIES: GTPase HflX [Pirellulaceae]PQO27576.1 GTPase HflX [Blastopirellula marina]RCS48113.1 GTPase HflX [Bremerella cremea]